MLNLSWKRKNKYIAQKRAELQKRVLTGKQKLSAEEKEARRAKKQKIKDKFEFANLGNFEMLYPVKDDEQFMTKFDSIIDISKSVWEESIGGGGIRKRETDSHNLNTQLSEKIKNGTPLN
mmetsp:Transcript_34870/g.26038  ORF Transcript_34870/g.26038 Transcript_34870/m.26038 type:complete len:120 (+) Transcript_34870:795-1154(+)